MTKPTPIDWIKFGKSDLTGARVLEERKIYHLACFHEQQAVEKLLKAYLIYLGQTPPKTHTLAELVERIAAMDPAIEELRAGTIMLDAFYIPTRYPDALPGSLPEGLPTKEHAEEAIRTAQEIVTRIEAQISGQQGGRA